MRIRMHLPHLEPDEYAMPTVCPWAGCQGEHFKLHQRHCRRSIADPEYEQLSGAIAARVVDGRSASIHAASALWRRSIAGADGPASPSTNAGAGPAA